MRGFGLQRQRPVADQLRIAAVLLRKIGRWMPQYALYCLTEFEVVRFNELKRYLKNVSDKTLSNNLKELEKDRLIIRKEYPQIPPKVEYRLSDKGKSLMVILDQLCIWGENNRE